MKPQFTPEQLREMFPGASVSTILANSNSHGHSHDGLPCNCDWDSEKGAPRERPHAPTQSPSAPPSPKAVKGVDRAEREIQNEFLAWLEHHRDRLYWISVRPDRKSTVRVGHPDVSIWGFRPPTRTTFGEKTSLLIEFKTEIGKLSGDQEQIHVWIGNIGAVKVLVCRSALEAIEQTKAHFGL